MFFNLGLLLNAISKTSLKDTTPLPVNSPPKEKERIFSTSCVSSEPSSMSGFVVDTVTFFLLEL